MKQQFPTEKLEELGVIVKAVWTSRNKFIFEYRFYSPNYVITSTLVSLSGYRDVQRLKGEADEETSGTICIQTRWTKPEERMTKVNFDAALYMDNKKLGIGLIARNCRGRGRYYSHYVLVNFLLEYHILKSAMQYDRGQLNFVENLILKM
ncbi:hypothetical protein I3760_04G157700 [Carya illinoinensis]|nr:hypothetical protein I3760_04G157700 [Carya illinoinensis]